MSENISWSRPGEVFADQLRRRREAARLTASELAAQLAEQGVPLRREAIERIERGERAAKLDEAIACAAVLQTPLGVMFFGLGDIDAAGLSAERAVHPDQWQQWLEGGDSAPGVDFTRPPFWKSQMHPVWIYQHLRDQAAESRRLHSQVDAARVAGDQAALTKRIEKYLQSCQEMVQTADDMNASGVRPPAWSQEFVADVKQLKEEADHGER